MTPQNTIMSNEKTLRDRFYKKVIVNDCDCWGWTGAKSWKENGGGFYGRINLNGVNISAHRASYIIHKGEIPEGMCVRHVCDNKECTNPNHLILGSVSDNNKDKTGKHRYIKVPKDNFDKCIEVLTQNKLL